MAAGIFKFLITAAAVPLCAEFMDGVTLVEMSGAIVLGLILAAIYTVLRPVAKLILSVVNFCTLGLINVVVDAWVVWTAAGLVKNSVVFENFWWALLVALAINVVRAVVDGMTGAYRR